MSTQIVRLANGDTIQVRTGVLKGSGPAGPPGPANSITVGTVVDGDAAAANISGNSPNQVLNLTLPRSTIQGPTGQISDFWTSVSSTAAASISPNVNTVLSFGTVNTDELSMIVNATTFRPVAVGGAARVLSFTVRVIFDNNNVTGSGFRRAWVIKNGTTIIGETNNNGVATANMASVVNVPVIERFTSGETFQVLASHSSGSAQLVTGVLRAIRVGAGPAGPPGPDGPATSLSIGTVTSLATGQAATASVTGTSPSQVLNLGLPKGDTGSSGNAGSGYAAIYDLDGSGGNVP